VDELKSRYGSQKLVSNNLLHHRTTLNTKNVSTVFLLHKLRMSSSKEKQLRMPEELRTEEVAISSLAGSLEQFQ
jgi:hypothetical protein